MQQTTMKRTDKASAEFIPQNTKEKNQTNILKFIQKSSISQPYLKRSHRHVLNSN